MTVYCYGNLVETYSQPVKADLVSTGERVARHDKKIRFGSCDRDSLPFFEKTYFDERGYRREDHRPPWERSTNSSNSSTTWLVPCLPWLPSSLPACRSLYLACKYTYPKDAQAISGELEETSIKSLHGLFPFVVMDECPSVKNRKSQANCTARWLGGDFNVLMSGTPISNGIDDHWGYMPFLEHGLAEYLWSEEGLKDLNVHESINPFNCADDSEIAVLRLTEKAFKRFIMPKRVPQNLQGRRMASMWKLFLIRRTNSSSIPFNTDNTIGACLPRMNSSIVSCDYLDEERKIYEESAKEFVSKLVDGVKRTYNFSAHRKLGLLTTWLSLPKLDKALNLKTANIQKFLAHKNIFELFMKALHPPILVTKDGIGCTTAQLLRHVRACTSRA